jgi:hypothetical protein
VTLLFSIKNERKKKKLEVSFKLKYFDSNISIMVLKNKMKQGQGIHACLLVEIFFFLRFISKIGIILDFNCLILMRSRKRKYGMPILFSFQGES